MISLFCRGVSGCGNPISLLLGLHLHRHGCSSTLSFPKTRVRSSASRMSNSRSPRNSCKYEHQDHNDLSLHGEFLRPRIEVPNIVLQLDTEEVLSGDNVLSLVDEAVSRWVGILILTGGEGSGGRLYQSACLLKSAIGDRAHLMISERVDIAAAVEASGVVLSDQGLPTLVARNSLTRMMPDSLELPLIGRHVSTQDASDNASTIEGADFLLHSMDQDELQEFLVNSVSQNVNIPIFITASRHLGIQNGLASCLLNLGPSGFVVSLEELRALCAIERGRMFYGIPERSKRKCHGHTSLHTSEGLDAENGYNSEVWLGNFETIEDKERHLIGVERLVLLEAVNIIYEAAPLMEEVSLIIDAASQLGKPFLLAVVGEFNSGKSTLINALLGRRYLKEGVVPTTNEVTFIQYREFGSNWEQHCERHPDGRLMFYLPVPMLKEMNIVDTPGTNVILQRQQYLTEEFVPRADLLLFVMSADRPFTESEVSFLRYTQKWKKKIVFVLNKSDTYQNPSELRQGISFIETNAQKILNTKDITLFPVSARYALEAKILALSHGGKVFGKASSFYSHWKNSGFEELENFLFSFLDLSSRSGLERIKLKLETPIRIADRLISACEAILIRESQNANEDLNSADEMVKFSEVFAAKILSECNSWKTQTLWLIDSTKIRVVKIVESILRLSNFELLASCIFGGNQFIKAESVLCVEKDILTPTYSSTLKLLEEYAFWLASVDSHQKRLCREAFEKRWPSFADPNNEAPQELQDVSKAKHCIEVIGDFDVNAISRLFEQEIREMFLETFGGLGMAGLSALLLTSVLRTTLEDLLALGFCSAGGLLAIASFPIRRQKIVNKVSKTAESLGKQLQDAMDVDRIECAQDMEEFLKNLVRPCQDAAHHRLHELSTMQRRISDVAQKLSSLMIEIQNIHLL